MPHVIAHAAPQDSDAERRADLLTHLRDYRAFTRVIRWVGALWLATLAILIPFAIH